MLIDLCQIRLIRRGFYAAQHLVFHPVHHPFPQGNPASCGRLSQRAHEYGLMLRQPVSDFHVLVAVDVSKPGLTLRGFADHISSLVAAVLPPLDIFTMSAHAFVPPSLVFASLSHSNRSVGLTAF